jgi:hypothetical protein
MIDDRQHFGSKAMLAVACIVVLFLFSACAPAAAPGEQGATAPSELPATPDEQDATTPPESPATPDEQDAITPPASASNENSQIRFMAWLSEQEREVIQSQLDVFTEQTGIEVIMEPFSGMVHFPGELG